VNGTVSELTRKRQKKHPQYGKEEFSFPERSTYTRNVKKRRNKFRRI